ncbi:1,2-phenylacetyl-CoA epoxidase subunit PaaC [Nocardioides marmoribigeumensis]|uniref:Ring-1,2-phenylacetyl-CoA epoxidase subunit PaaC n=1 Tax=Nocardioides marmoribigeumensis TaxID=433649 RepID=A0ABU2BSG9_9ACTN|nr:Phenylacetic acid catabolic protein [Nocardioides marmoribigeumensis]MDR7361211.1 ring-1,2-phenylacetyl-CoA epoxidase subunit PaaC [Nocardioides marmoribigeumensis]
MDEVHDDPYSALLEPDVEDGHWAFGGGWDDPLEGLDAAVPEGIDAAALASYCLALGDDALVLAQRLQQWCARAPELEEEVALANVALDLLGQTRLLYARAAAADPGLVDRLAPGVPAGSPVPGEDRLAFFRDPADFRCDVLMTLPDADFAHAVVRLAAVSLGRVRLWHGLAASPDPVLAAVAGRAVKEVAYHRDHAVGWVRVLAGGTDESRRRTGEAWIAVTPWVGRPDLAAAALPGVVPDPGTLAAETRSDWLRLGEECDLSASSPDVSAYDGRAGRHAPWLAELLEELQSLARQHPEGRW